MEHCRHLLIDVDLCCKIYQLQLSSQLISVGFLNVCLCEFFRKNCHWMPVSIVPIRLFQPRSEWIAGLEMRVAFLSYRAYKETRGSEETIGNANSKWTSSRQSQTHERKANINETI
jgi:hypothetical protein